MRIGLWCFLFLLGGPLGAEPKAPEMLTRHAWKPAPSAPEPAQEAPVVEGGLPWAPGFEYLQFKPDGTYHWVQSEGGFCGTPNFDRTDKYLLKPPSTIIMGTEKEILTLPFQLEEGRLTLDGRQWVPIEPEK